MESRGICLVLVLAALSYMVSPSVLSGQEEYVFVRSWPSDGTGLYSPRGLAVDNSGNVYVADYSNHRVQKFTSAGVFLTKWGTHGVGGMGLSRPYGIAIGPSGLVYVVDAGNQCIKVYGSLSGQAVTPGEKQLITWGKAKQPVLYQNYPNPFNPETWIPYRLAQSGKVVITIYNSAGQLMRELNPGYQPPGVYLSRNRAVYWDGRNQQGESVGSGIYFYQLVTNDGFSATKKMIVIR